VLLQSSKVKLQPRLCETERNQNCSFSTSRDGFKACTLNNSIVPHKQLIRRRWLAM